MKTRPIILAGYVKLLKGPLPRNFVSWNHIPYVPA